MPWRDLALACAVVVGFIGLLLAGSRWLPGTLAKGAVLDDGGRLRYRLNGLALFVLTVLAVLAIWWKDPQGLTYPARHTWELFAAANLIAFLAAGSIYALGRRRRCRQFQDRSLVATIRGYVFGLELNPRYAGIDVKLFFYRPSLIGLFLLNVSFLAGQYVDHGSVSGRMALYQVLFFLYIANYFQFEGVILHTWDVVAERFGWTLVWGDLVLVPFFYSLPGRQLATIDDPLSGWLASISILLFLLGGWMFRGANGQKHRFKEDSTARIWGRPAQTLDGRLLVSGFWGIGRKLNYTGEFFVYVSWTILCGPGAWAPYTVLAFLALLFWHRARRDDRRCSTKYGPLWDQYCQKARFRMIPFLY